MRAIAERHSLSPLGSGLVEHEVESGVRCISRFFVSDFVLNVALPNLQ